MFWEARRSIRTALGAPRHGEPPPDPHRAGRTGEGDAGADVEPVNPIHTLDAGVETCERRSATMRTKLNATRRRIVAASLALAIAVAVSAAHVPYAGTSNGTSPTPPVSQCSLFACEP